MFNRDQIPETKNQLQPKNSQSFDSRSAPRKFFATIFPVGSIKKFCGIEVTRYFTATSLFQNFKSLTCVHVRLSSLIACNQGSRLLSRETLRIVKFFALNLLYATTTLGFSMRHG